MRIEWFINGNKRVFPLFPQFLQFILPFPAMSFNRVSYLRISLNAWACRNSIDAAKIPLHTVGEAEHFIDRNLRFALKIAKCFWSGLIRFKENLGMRFWLLNQALFQELERYPSWALFGMAFWLCSEAHNGFTWVHCFKFWISFCFLVILT